jgi:hypothetical protein
MFHLLQIEALSIKEKTLIANIRTALMLFVVAIVFGVTFFSGMADVTPSGVMNYMYFMYNTANPLIQAFMNKSFRDDLGKVLKCNSMAIVKLLQHCYKFYET